MSGEKKRILIFAHYYYPDVASTGQILKDQAQGMLDDFDVTVVCAVPSYGGNIPPEYKTKKYYFESINGVRVIRVRVPEFSKSSKISRIKNILVYILRALVASGKAGSQEYVYAISQPPVLGGLLGVLGKWQKHAKLIYCIQDFNPEQIMAVGYFGNRFLLRCAMAADKFSCRKSDIVITVGRDLVENFRKRFKGATVPNHIMINNWIDEKKIYPLVSDEKHVFEFRKKYGIDDKFVIMYSGNIGLYYDLENIIKVIGKFRGARTNVGKEVAFVFVGDGAILDRLTAYVEKNQLGHIVFIPYQDKENLIYSLNAGDVHWCVNTKGIKGVSCPSKIYGIMAAGKPILGVLEEGTEARGLIEQCGCGRCCEPGQYEEIGKLVRWFIENDFGVDDELHEMGMRGRNFLVQNLAKDISIRKYCETIKGL